MELAKARPEDLPLLKEHYDAIIDRTPGMERHARWKKGLYPTEACLRAYIGENAMYLLAADGGIAASMAVTMQQGADYRPVLWGAAAGDGEVAVIHVLGVNPAWQGRGLGGRMIDEALRLAAEQRKKAVRLDALATNAPARRLYAAKGFVCRGTRRLYAENTGWTEFCFYERAL